MEASNPATLKSTDAPEQGNTLRALVHICCGPCSVYPLRELLKGRIDVTGFFYNPNIHPYSEFKKRLDAAKALSRHMGLEVIFHEKYEPSRFVAGMKKMELPSSAASHGSRRPERATRCLYCYAERLEKTAAAARDMGFEYFTTSLLYSRYQMHEEIRKTGIDLAAKYGILFLYGDFRAGWEQGIEEARTMGLYRQKYCGCIYSRIERDVEKRLKKQRVIQKT